ncbi:universal stress protein [Maribacter sp. 2307ULW6-5]|uniref:universal stress protein n=1 Tax=Maribacter sp. 2307ULW6-5 TaxID=3386275 RepID=UPI0039BC75A1
MSSISKILIPFDFTEPAISALEYGLQFVGYERPIAIEALYVSKVPTAPQDVKEIKEDFAKLLGSMKIKPKIAPTIVIGQGALVPTILEERKAQNIELILMGTLGDISADEHVTNASKLVLQADCPVITVPYGAKLQVPKKIALVLGKEEIEHPKLLGLLLHIARSFNAKVHVLTIYKDSIYDEKVVVESNEETLEYYLEHFYAEHNFEQNDDIEEGILQYIKDKKIDLLAILPRNHADRSSPSEGRLTKILTLHATVPVLTLD